MSKTVCCGVNLTGFIGIGMERDANHETDFVNDLMLLPCERGARAELAAVGLAESQLQI
jgi:hypothetical protein